jgi:nitroimidazol reductase NimA-like FMN-containing flavoprotein (pyridoxamine 5'-phosphate oxidase superfamily)
MPEVRLDEAFSEPAATATPWKVAEDMLSAAGVFWLTTVRPDGRPHVTPLIAVWLDDALFFCTGERERKRRNLGENPHCVMTTGCNTYGEGLDVVVEGEALRTTDEALLRRVADGYVDKYGEEWRFEVRDGTFWSDGHEALVYRVAPTKAFGFHKGEPFSQTRWTF